jgi:hypothetical protein
VSPIPANDEDETDLNAANEQIVEEVSLVDVDIDAERARQRAEHRTHQVRVCFRVGGSDATCLFVSFPSHVVCDCALSSCR